MVGSPAPLYVILLNHGGRNGSFHLGDQTLTPTELAAWLDELEGDLRQRNPMALQKPRIVLLGYCYSGTFIPELSQAPLRDEADNLTDAGRIIIHIDDKTIIRV